MKASGTPCDQSPTVSRSGQRVWRSRARSSSSSASGTSMRNGSTRSDTTRELTRGGAARDEPHELGAGGDLELLEDLAQVVLDGLRAQEQLPGDLAVATALDHQP